MPTELQIPLPPQAMRFMNEDDARFIRIGDEHLADALRFCEPDTVFDFGCGYGRLAYALRRRGFTGRYVGMDILKRHIEWLQENFTDDAYQFRQINVHNARYNPNGTKSAADMTFDLPFSPDLTLILSVFTHLYEDEIDIYLRKLRDVVHPDSVVVATAFLLSGDKSRRPYNFEYRLNDHCSYHNADDPLHAIAYDEAWFRELIRNSGFFVDDLSYGWQDRLVLRPLY